MKLDQKYIDEINKAGLIKGKFNSETFYIGKFKFIQRMHPSFTVEEFRRITDLGLAIKVKKKFSKRFGYVEILSMKER